MDENSSLTTVMNALSEVLENRGGGMITGAFVVAAEVLLPSGKYATYLLAPGDQPTHRTQGLIRYADQAYATEVHMQMIRYFMDEEEDE